MSKSPGLRRVGLADDNGDTTVTTFPDFDSQRNRSQERDAIGFGEFLSAPFAENLIAISSIGSDEITHVFDYTQNWNRDCLEHSERPPHVSDGYVLRGCYKHCTLNGNELSKRQLHVACARGHVNNQVIQ